MVAWSEGTSTVPGSDNGYRVLVGGHLFASYDDHPRQLVHLASLGLSSTAAGRYQLLARYFDVYKRQLGLTDFSPRSQDAIAIQQIKECHALPCIEAGNLDAAIAKCSRIWASLPGNNYGQHMRPIKALRREFVEAGGTIQPSSIQ